MLQTWKDYFKIVKDVRFGPIVDNDGIKLFFDEDEKVIKTINNLKTMLESECDFRSIMIAGHAGSGKTTLVHYIKSKIDPSLYDIFIINGEENTDDLGIVGAINHSFNNYFDAIHCSLNTKDIQVDRDIKKILDVLFSELAYASKIDKLKYYIECYNKLYENTVLRNSGHVKKVRIILDQIDLLDSKEMMKILNDNFSLIIHATNITAVICARFETLESAKRSVNNFFATNFNRYITIDSVPVDLVLKKRLEAGTDNAKISRKEINSVFTESFCDLMFKIQNGNIRKALSIFEHIMCVMPIYSGRIATDSYINFLLENDYIDDLYTKLNPIDTIPLIKIVFDALQYQSIVNSKFYDIIKVKTMVNASKGIGYSQVNIKVALEFLINRSIISDAFDISDRYVLTPKGETYKKLITTKPYIKRYCKTENDIIFSRNPFDETSFI